jgi:ligand-binding sensor domain-containing protein
MNIPLRQFCLHTLMLLVGQMLPFHALAQTPNLRFETVEMPDESPLSSTNAIYEDSRGFMWFGGLSGLYMFDGYKVTHFENDPDDSLSISDNKVHEIIEDNQGNMWIGTQNGLNYLDVRKKTFKRYNDAKKCGLGVTGIHDMEKDKTGNIWVFADNNLYKSDLKTQRFNKCQQRDTTQKMFLRSLEVGGNQVFIGTTTGLYACDLDAQNWRLLPSKDLVDMQKNKCFVNALKNDKQGNLWIGTNKGFYYLDKATDSIRSVKTLPSLDSAYVGFIKEKSANELWISTLHGLLIFNKKTFKYEKFTHDPANSLSIPKDAAQVGFHATHDILWLSINPTELHKVDMRKQQFQNIAINLFDANFSIPRLFEFYEFSPNVLLLPLKDGANLFDITTQKKVPFPYKPIENLEGWQKEGMTCFLEEAEGKLWIGTSGGLFLFDKKANKFINIEAQMKEIISLRNSPLRKIVRDRKGNLWVSTWHQGVYKINFEKKTFRRYLSDGRSNGFIANTRTILEDKKGTIWVGTRGGLLKYMEAADTFKLYKNVLNDPKSMSENTAFCLYEDKESNMWVGTYGGGLDKLDVNTGVFKHYTVLKNGLVDNNIIGIFPDKQDNLWLATFAGISVFNPKTEAFRNYKSTQGLINKELAAFLMGKSIYSDRLFFGGEKGIDFFDPNVIQVSTYDPNIWLTDFKIFNKSVPILKDKKIDSIPFYLTEDIAFTQHLTLNYDQNVIGFDFAALDFSAPKNVQYAYILENFDKNWQYIGNNRSATFTNLNAGDYTFKVKATNSDGVWGSKMAIVKLTVLAPWWQTWWFRTLVLLSLLSVGFAFYQYRIKQIQEREAIKTSLNKRIAEVKMEALRAQMNPHFIFNALTSINLFILKNDTELASFYLNKFSRLMREVLDHSRSDLITVEAELNTLKIYVEIEKMRFRNAFDFVLDIPTDARIKDVLIPPLIIQPYVENAIWHGLKHKKEGEGILKIAVSEADSNMFIVVEDNGVGRENALKLKENATIQHKSHGLDVTEERIQQFNNTHDFASSIETIDLINDHQEGIGTRIVFTIKTGH